jgi:hypothetical protein
MRLRFFVVLALVATALLTVPAAAQTAGDAVDAATGGNQTDAQQSVGQLSPVVRIVSYRYHAGNETMRVTLDATIPRLVTVRDALTEVGSEGFTRRPDARTVNLARGRNVILVDATPLDGEAVVEVADPRAGTGGYLSTGVGGRQLLHERNPAAAWFGGLAIGTGAVVGGGWYGVRRLGGEPRRGRA